MNNKRDIAKDDMVPQQEEPAVPDALEKAQKDAAEDRLEEGGYQ